VAIGGNIVCVPFPGWSGVSAKRTFQIFPSAVVWSLWQARQTLVHFELERLDDINYTNTIKRSNVELSELFMSPVVALCFFLFFLVSRFVFVVSSSLWVS
jgi:hypothetical protein